MDIVTAFKRWWCRCQLRGAAIYDCPQLLMYREKRNKNIEPYPSNLYLRLSLNRFTTVTPRPVCLSVYFFRHSCPVKSAAFF
jgi:hypothetical protein